jgi:hypothetical protein
MTSRSRKLTTAVLAAIAALTLAACGDSHTKVTTGTYAGESGKNAPYLHVGELKYQVQLSRQLNPANSEDSAYLAGLTPAQRNLAPGQQWFGVFMQVYNTNSTSALAAPTMTIADTQGNTYTPLLTAPTNLFTYRGGVVPAKGKIPEPDTPAYAMPSQGAVLVYKIQTASLDNRPLVLKIANPTNLAETASAELDV